MSLRTLLTGLLLACTLSAQAATEIIPLNYRTSADLLPVARDFIGKDGKVSAYQNQLIVNAEPDKINELRDFLGQLDKPAKRLLISVDTSENNDQNEAINGQNQTRIINYGTASRDGGLQQVQTVEGAPALIQVGQSVPLTTAISTNQSFGTSTSAGSAAGTGTTQTLNPNQQPLTQIQNQYRNVTQGFYVTASVTGDIVHLSISTNRDRISQERQDVVNVQSTDTTVSGRLGEWITLAGVNGQSQADRQALTRSYSTSGRNDMTLRVKVDTLD
ncbi:secretin N-terminal domain-containing protein [Pseudomonas batumici]|uniref:Type II and III secretion system family protein n=1 Tax=Pseudomonas batumici TaxID=226910 RepID=A0A0C2EAA2_9PSED|nr:secretin N-terminal domain-containing protein [Pseudomonas batumici]KIH82789.1 Type II and III secretion system family protein [Pseudomonas batumici]